MQKSELRILIIEDDPSLGKAVEEGLRRSGYTTQLVAGYNQALAATEITDFHGMVVDCMLPQKSGLEAALEIIKNTEMNMTVVFTSGVFKNRSFAHEALLKTRGKVFLQKPFEIQELIGHFDEAFASQLDDHREPLFQLLMRDQYSFRDKIAAINGTDYVHGFDLPFVYNLLLDQQISGHLQIQYDENQPKTIIGFNRGRIDQVLHHDKESYFGVLLVEKGFTTPEELQQGLEEQDKTPIGQFLVDNSVVSPHAIEIVQHEQMIIRISKTIQDTSVKITFNEEPKKNPSVFIDGFNFPSLLSDWINTKISSEWLKSFYTPWLEYPILRGAESSKMNLLSNIPAGRYISNYVNKQSWPHSLQDMLSQNAYQEEEFLKGIHFFMLQRVLSFGPKNSQNENHDVKINRLEKILASFKNKNHFEILGLSKKARPSEIHRAYHDLAKTLHPDKLAPNSPEKIMMLTQLVFSNISDAHQVLSNEKRRLEYLKTLEFGHADEILKAESSFEEGIKSMQANQFREARKIFERTIKMRGHRSDTIIYIIWSLIKEKRHKMDRKTLAEKVREMLHHVAHEDRHSPPYFFIKGMCYELTGQVQKAYQHFKHCVAIDPYFMDAKKEISYIKQNYAGQKTKSFGSELTTVVTKIFKKKTG